MYFKYNPNFKINFNLRNIFTSKNKREKKLVLNEINPKIRLLF